MKTKYLLYVFSVGLILGGITFAGAAAIYEPYTVTTIAGWGNNAGSTDGPPEQAEFNNPQGTAVDRQGNVYVVEYENHAVRKITPDGVVSTFAGVADESGSADGTGSDARFSSCYGAGVGPDGYIYVADTQNDTIRKISRTAVVTTLAGSPGVIGFVDGQGSAALFGYPAGATVDKAGEIFIADLFNNAIRKITPDGTVTTFAGNGTFGSKDGTGTEAEFGHPNDREWRHIAS